MKFKCLIGLSLAAYLSPSAVLAQNSASAPTTGTTRIVQPITISKTTDLAFGTIVRPTASTNSIIVSEVDGARTKTGSGDAALVASTVTRAAYSVGGEGGQTYSVSVPASFAMTSGANSITVNLTPSATSGTLSGSIGSSGTATFGVGGNFSIAGTQATGNYAGSFTATVVYN